MAAIIDVNDLASLASFQSRVRSRLLIHALAITAVPPKTMADEAAYASARQIVQTGGNGTGLAVVNRNAATTVEFWVTTLLTSN